MSATDNVTFGSVSHPEVPSATPPLPGAPLSEQRVLIAALALGVIGDQLVAHGRPGIGVTLALLLFVGPLLWLNGKHQLALPLRERWPLLGVVCLFAVVLSVRESSDLTQLNVGAMLLAFTLFIVRVTDRRLSQLRVGELALAAIELPIVSAVRVVGAVGRQLRPQSDDHEDSQRASRFGGHGRDIVIGILLAVPVLSLFTALFAASDRGFARLIERLFNWDVGTIITHGFVMLVLAWVAAALLIAALAGGPITAQDERRSAWAAAPVVWIVLGSTAALFMTFLALQARYLFGGAKYLEEKAGLTAAEYARHGFFELLTVAVLVVPLLLVMRHWYREEPRAARAFRIMAPLLAALTVVVVVSAFVRLWLYQDRFGLTPQRLLAAAVLLWVASIVGWMGIRIAQRHALMFTTFACISGLVVVAMLNLANPDALVARTNIERANKVALDIDYLANLGPDATPTILDRFDSLSARQQAVTAVELLRRDRTYDDGWRSTHLSRVRAHRAVSTHREELRAALND